MRIPVVMNGEKDNGHDVHLSNDIIFYNILTRIPTKDLHRFRCVCKLWSTLFRDSLFVSSYKTRSGFISLERYYRIGHEKETTTYNFIFYDVDKKEEKLIPFQLPENGSISPGSDICLENSFNGLLLMSFGRKYFVYNLVTAAWLYIGTSTLELFHDAVLAYDPIVSKYKVVAYSQRDIQVISDMKCSSYVSRPDHLRDFEIATFVRPVSVSFCLHWICTRIIYVVNSNASKEEYSEILRLDVSTEKMSTITLPVKVVSYSGYLGLLEMGGLLWFFQASSDCNMRLWYLKKKIGSCFNEGDEWVLLFLRSSPVLLKDPRWIRSPVLFVMGPKCEILFTSLEYQDKQYKKSVWSYDVELNQWDLICAMRTSHRILYMAWQ